MSTIKNKLNFLINKGREETRLESPAEKASKHCNKHCTLHALDFDERCVAPALQGEGQVTDELIQKAADKFAPPGTPQPVLEG